MNTPNRPRRSKARGIAWAILLLVAIGCGVGAYWYFWMRGVVSTDDARIDGDLVDIAPQINGVIDSIPVKEGQTVHAGQVLVRLDSRQLAAAAEVAQAQLASASAQLASLVAAYQQALHGPRPREIEMAEAAQKQAAAQAQLADTDWQRAQALYRNQALAKSDLDKARTTEESAKEALRRATENLKLLHEGTRSEEIAAAHARVEQASADVGSKAAALHEARVALGYATITAPFDGVVARRWRAPGAMVPLGTPILTLLNPASLHVSANVEERDLDRVAIGDPVDISVDAFPDTPIHGKVERILRATNSQFSLIPSEGVAGTFIKVSQRVPLWIKILGKPQVALSPGLSVEVRVHVSGPPTPPTLEAHND